MSNLNDLQNSTDNNEEDVMNTNLSDLKRELYEKAVDVPKEESSKNLNKDTVDTFFT